MLFNVNMPGILANAMGSLMLDGTLISVAHGARTDGDLTAGKAKTPTNYAFKGFVDSYREGVIDGVLIKIGDRKVTILAGTLSGAVPHVGDSITIEGETRKIVGDIIRDPAAATYTCQVR